MTEEKSLVKKLAKIMGEIGHVKKTGRNDFHKYDYVEEHALVDAVRGKLSEQNIFIFPSVVEHKQEGSLATVMLEFTIVDGDSGETMKSYMAGQGDDKGDKAYYKAYTGAVKYFLMKTFLIPTGDDPERDIETDKRAARPPVTKQQVFDEGTKKGLVEDEIEALIVVAKGDLDYCLDAFRNRSLKNLQQAARKAMQVKAS